MIKISVFIPTYNPSLKIINATLEGLKNQDLSLSNWELILINNNSSNGFEKEIEVDWHPNFKFIHEPKPGLTYARLKGFEAAAAPYIIMVDDDNILNENYLTNTIALFEKNESLGAIGGIVNPIFEVSPPLWIEEFYPFLALRDFGQEEVLMTWAGELPKESPLGAGMAIRKIALKKYIHKIESNKAILTDRIGKQLSSGGDNDIVLEILKDNWQVMYSPSLILQHLIPSERLQAKYLSKLAYDTGISGVRLLHEHGINVMKTLTYRQYLTRVFKAWKTMKPWQNEVNYIKYNHWCGTLKGLTKIHKA